MLQEKSEESVQSTQLFVNKAQILQALEYCSRIWGAFIDLLLTRDSRHSLASSFPHLERHDLIAALYQENWNSLSPYLFLEKPDPQASSKKLKGFLFFLFIVQRHIPYLGFYLPTPILSIKRINLITDWRVMNLINL